MKILIIDRDEVTANLIKARLAPSGHQVEIQLGRSEGLDQVIASGWDLIFFDPSPMTNVKQIVTQMRRNARRSVFMALLSDSLTHGDAIAAGFNDFVAKPVDAEKVNAVVESAGTLNSMLRHLANNEEDYPSAGGVIAKSAFNQLFLSCLDRADRYGEQSHILFIAFDNFKAISVADGAYDAETISAKLAHHLVRLRRQSDIISQIRKNEYALLLLRPLSESEPVDAANRFAEALSKCTDLPTNPIMDVNIRITLMSLPTGSIVIEHKFSLRQ